MKIFSIKRVLGLAAIGGAVAYARKHGGFKNAFKGLVQKKDEILSASPGTDGRAAYGGKVARST